MKMATIRRWLWWAFVIWTGLEFLLMPFDIGRVQIVHLISWLPLRQLVLVVAGVSDAIWIILAASFVYFYLIHLEGLKSARRVAGVILLGSFMVEWIGLKTGLPFGPYIYTAQLGRQILGVPFSIPLLWLVIVCISRYAVLHFLDHAQRWKLALGTGLLVAGTDLGLEWVAWRIRAYRLWYFPAANTPDWPPLQNYLGWFVLSALFAWMAFPATRPAGKHWQPLLMLGMINLLFWVTIVTRLGHQPF